MSKINDKIDQGCRHSGYIRLRMIIDLLEAMQCNYFICTKKSLIDDLVSPDHFSLLQGAEYLRASIFNTPTA